MPITPAAPAAGLSCSTLAMGETLSVSVLPPEPPQMPSPPKPGPQEPVPVEGAAGFCVLLLSEFGTRLEGDPAGQAGQRACFQYPDWDSELTLS